jgi:hypothetical protein
MPECPIAMAYASWYATQISGDALGFCIQNKDVWLQEFGLEGEKEFERSMRVEGRPSLQQTLCTIAQRASSKTGGE